MLLILQAKVDKQVTQRQKADMFALDMSEVMAPALTGSGKDLNKALPQRKSYLPLRELEVNL